jgi:hypothetical protein
MTCSIKESPINRFLSSCWNSFQQIVLESPTQIDIQTTARSIHEKATRIMNFLEDRQSSATISQDEIMQTARAVNQLIQDLLKTQHQEISPTPQDLYSIHRLSSRLLVSDASTLETWKHLSTEAKTLAQNLNPFILPPTEKADLTLHICNSRLVERNPCIIRLGDSHQFRMQFQKEELSALHFSLTDHPKVVLKGTGALSRRDLNKINPYVADLPLGIQDFFKTDSLTRKIREEATRPFLAAQTIPQLTHQLLLSKMLYQIMQLKAMGVPVASPLQSADQGEWVIEPAEDQQRLHDVFNSKQSLLFVEDQIAQFFILERQFGIYLMGDAFTSFNSEETCLFNVRGSTLLSSIAQKKLSFIEEPIELRHQRILSYLQACYPSQEDILDRIKKTIDKYPSIDSIAHTIKTACTRLHFSPDDAICEDFAQCLRALPSKFYLQEIPWEIFASPKDFLLFCRLHQALDGFKQMQKGDRDTFAYACKSLITLLPRKYHPNPLQMGTDFSNVIMQDTELRKDLNQLTIRILLDDWVKHPKLSLEAHLERLIAQINTTLDQDPDLQSFDHTGHASLSSYFSAIYWTHFLDDFNERVLNSSARPKLEDTLAAIKASQMMGDNEGQRKLEQALHQNLLEYEQLRAKDLVEKKIKLLLINI